MLFLVFFILNNKIYKIYSNFIQISSKIYVVNYKIKKYCFWQLINTFCKIYLIKIF